LGVGLGGHGAGPDAAGGIAFAVVAAERGVGGLELSERFDAAGFDRGIVGGGDEAEGRGNFERATLERVFVEPVQLAVNDVDPIETAQTRVPDGTFAVLGHAGGEEGEWGEFGCGRVHGEE
jgi:hypothetical protein